MIVEYIVGFKNLLQHGISQLVFYDGLLYSKRSWESLHFLISSEYGFVLLYVLFDKHLTGETLTGCSLIIVITHLLVCVLLIYLRSGVSSSAG